MLPFLLKSTACLAIFLAFYKLVLENESIHHFKRFYLLGALIVSFVIPNLVFIEYIDVVQPNMESFSPIVDQGTDAIIEQPVPQTSVFDWQLLLWIIYGLGIIGFGLRFIANLLRIRLRIKKNPKFKDNFVTKVLLTQTLPPHTFLNFIFLNQQQFEAKNIPHEVLLHEETHARQRHSLDILLIELLQVILWFNPLIYLFKSSIKLNHEFLADKAVIKKNLDHSQYQNTLLSYLSNGIENHQSVGIANAINYSSIKKRFTVMKTKTSKRSFVLRSLLLLPLTALLLFGFSEHRQIEREVNANHIITMDILSKEKAQIDNDIVHFNEVAQILNQKYLATYNSGKTKVNINVDQPIHLKTINNWSKEIRTTGIELIEVFANEVIMEENEFQDNIPITPSTTLLNAKRMTVIGIDQKEVAAVPSDSSLQNEANKTINPVEIHINKNGKLLLQNRLVPLEDLKDELSKINNHLSFEQRKKIIRSIVQVEADTSKEVINKVDKVLTEYGSATINILGPKETNQQSASREEMKEYNTLAKKYNEMDRNHMMIKKREVMRLKEIYGKMSKKQRENAEPFPDFPTPPPAPKAPKSPKNVSDTKYAANQIKKVIDTQDPYDVVGSANTNAPINPVPPAPPKPIEHIKKMAEKGATFFYNGKEISAKKAIEVVKNNNKINIDSRESHSPKPVVKLSTHPIVIEN